jgi:formamidopyrimidine-DNA glycosylase
MPELPEVETIRRQLEKEIVDKRIASVDVFFAGKLNVSSLEFRHQTEGKTIKAIRRRAKMLLIDLSGGKTLAVHLKMTGKLLLSDSGEDRDKHVHVIFGLPGGRKLMFRDVRKFGWIRLLETDRVEGDLLDAMKLGPEPLSSSFTEKIFSDCLISHPKATIKPLIMSQRCVVGSGNIYTDEALWKSCIRPDRKAGTLSDKEISRLYRDIKDILKEAVRHRGSSVDDFVDAYGRPGKYELKHEAYGRGGEECARCHTPIEKIRLGGRGTHFCPKCQK